ncbi:protein of unknown function DUF488 [Candidatus Koribacter versatilis Ellin345]|uniref:Uroporphyrin-III C-methyltransferase n=1 Tax=Koribacter versatilis (strain Ellin345) TaxID=204669 RepID=Q1II07_KORVE|nr:DUF488 family protein [Candidatus Koribacter versatilis]ABF43493.1 protein of unknown function DUF488 [Candidatus Koribacter versatilis Ellin345]
MNVQLKRAYDEPSASDGKRFLVDRLWPRGKAKEALHIEAWLKDLAPSDELRKWFHERPAQWLLFRRRYLAELSAPAAEAALEQLYSALAPGRRVTLVYSSKNEAHNNAVVLKELIEGARKPPTGTGPVREAGRQRARAQR